MTRGAAEGGALAASHIAVGDVDLEVYRGGSGPTLLFLHGGGGVNPQAPALQDLARHFSLVAPVHPGFGASSLPFWMDSVDDFTHINLALMEQLDLRDVTLVGTSLGGWIAADLATKNRSRLSRLVLVSPVGIKVGPRDRLDIPDVFAMSQRDVDRLMYADPQRFGFSPDGKSDDDLRVLARNRETLALVTWDPYMHSPKLKHRLQVIDRPTLFLRGAEDGLVSQSYVEAYASFIPGAVVETIGAAGHLPQVEQPDEFVKRILRFVQS